MKLQLPADKSERNKVLFMIGLFSVGILYVVITFGLLPYRANVRTGRERLKEIEEKLWQADRNIRQMQANRARNIETIQHILDVSETQRHILRPSLGNYLLVAEAELNEVAEQAGVTIRNIRETSGPPPAAEQARANQLPALWPYAVNFNVEAGIHDFILFLHSLQNHNPYVAVVNTTVSAGTAQHVARHVFNVTVQWPVWKDPEQPNRLSAELLTDEEQ